MLIWTYYVSHWFHPKKNDLEHWFNIFDMGLFDQNPLKLNLVSSYEATWKEKNFEPWDIKHRQ